MVFLCLILYQIITGNLADPEGLKNLNNMANGMFLEDWLDAIEACQQLEQTPKLCFH